MVGELVFIGFAANQLFAEVMIGFLPFFISWFQPLNKSFQQPTTNLDSASVVPSFHKAVSLKN